MKIKGFQFPTEPKVSFYAPEDKSYNFDNAISMEIELD